MYGALQFTKHFQCIHPLNWSLKPPWEVDGTHMIVQQFAAPRSCHAGSRLCDFTRALPESWNVLFSPLWPIFHPVNSQSTWKINATAASFQIPWKPPVWFRCFPSGLSCSLCGVAMATFSCNDLLASLALTRLCTNVIPWILSYLPDAVPVTQWGLRCWKSECAPLTRWGNRCSWMEGPPSRPRSWGEAQAGLQPVLLPPGAGASPRHHALCSARFCWNTFNARG